MLQQQKIEIDQKYLSCIKREDKLIKVDAEGMYYKDLNALLRQAISSNGIEKIEIQNVCGQRYIGTDLDTTAQIDIYGTPGNDLGAFMNGPKLVVHGNAQDGCGNTMNDGQIIIHGHAGDVTGNSMRGGKIFVRDYVGYRVGIHMKQYQKKIPPNNHWTIGRRLPSGVHGRRNHAHPRPRPQKWREMQSTFRRHRHAWRRNLRTRRNPRTRQRNKNTQRWQTRPQNHRSPYQRILQPLGADPKEIMNSKFKKILPVSKRPYAKLFSH